MEDVETNILYKFVLTIKKHTHNQSEVINRYDNTLKREGRFIERYKLRLKIKLFWGRSSK